MAFLWILRITQAPDGADELLFPEGARSLLDLWEDLRGSATAGGVSASAG